MSWRRARPACWCRPRIPPRWRRQWPRSCPIQLGARASVRPAASASGTSSASAQWWTRRPRSTAARPAGEPRSRLRVAAAARLDAPPTRVADPAELLQDLLAVGHAPGHAIERLGGQEERRLRHQLWRLAARIVDALHEPVVDGARRRNDLRGRNARDRDAVRVDLSRQPLREPLERGLLGPVAGSAAGAGGRVPIRAPPRADRGARRDVHDRAGSSRNHRGERQLAQDEGRVKVHGPRAQPLVQREVLHRQVVRERRVVDEDVDGPVALLGRAHELLALGGIGDVHRDRSRLAAAPASRIAATVVSSEPASWWSPSRSVRAAQITRPPSAAKSRAISAPMPREAPVTTTTLPSSLRMCGRLPRWALTPAARSRTAAHEYRHRADHASRAGGGGPGEFPAMPPGNARWRELLATSTLTTGSREVAS